MNEEIVLEAKDLHKSFYSPEKVSVLKGVSLQVKKGESVAIMGRSGEGKSTLLQILGTLENPCAGELLIFGKRPSDVAEVRNKHMGFVFQSSHLLEDYTVLENVLMPAKIARKPTDKNSPSYQRALLLVEEVGLSQRAHFPAKLLSGGEKQRAAIARALCNDPELIFADEPSGNLDHANSLAIHSLLLNAVKKHKKTLLIVTHDQELASTCDRTLLLNDGVLTEFGNNRATSLLQEITCTF
jgi:lipoprotein-releasing system ATP-binding protein